MSILPTFSGAEEITQEQILPVEYEIDFQTGKLTGKKVKGIEAIKVWIWMCLKTERYRFALYSWDYGTELEQYIGSYPTQEFMETDCRNEVEEALTINLYISGIDNFEVSMEKDVLKMSFLVRTTLGDVEINV